MFPMMHSRLLLICCVVYSVICLSSAGPYCKGQYETPVECIDQCQTCEYKNGGCAQPAVCIEGCDCIPGFFRNKQNQCIPAAFCPAVCGPNSKPSECVFCEPTCRNPKPQACAQSCAKGCACDDGFLKDDNGNCIPKNKCPTVCGPNSKPSECVFCEPTCRNPKPQVCAQSCTKGCACDDGFLKDDNGNCIPKYECPIVCGPNSKPSDCVSLCEPTCRKRKPGFCPQACTRGCACDDGFLKDDNGNCVPENKCPIQCKSDEQYYPDIPDCKNTCENYNNPGAICPQYFAARPGCFCATGLVKRQDGKCVKPENCFPPGPPQQCPAGEFPVKCIDRCQRCEYKNGNCSQILSCTPGCNCVPGFLRDSTNKCIPADFCPGTGPGPAQQCPAGEYPVPCVDRCQRCEYKNGNCGQGQACTPGCNCVPGFLRDKTNKCIPANLCPDQCKSDEQYYSDIPDCKNTCENYNNPGAICPQYFAARPGCFCAIGLVKRKDGKCVKPENCFPPGFPCSLEVDAGPCYGYFPRFYFNKKTGQCEEFTYGGCKGNANNFEDKKLCEIVCKGPGPGPAQQCPAGEIPVGCIDRCQRCEYKNGNCAQAQVCTPGCNCAPGFLRDSTNKCIPANFCPDQCKSDEEYYPDIPDCKNTCEYINNPGTICPQYFAPRPGCFCKKGLVKRKDGKCVRPENCGPPPGFPCSLEVDAGPCYGYFPRFYFNKKTGQCEEFIYGGCKGNANNFEDKKICEIVCKGPPRPQQCPSGEIPGCIDGCQRCEYKNGNCSQIQVCTPGCNCVPGFLRDSTNKCIPADFCPGNNPNKPCLQEKDPGPCRAYIKRFYYNKKTGQCEEFIYGGCEGNANNFEDKKLCEIVCKGPGPTQQCGQYERPVECIDQCQTCEYRNGGCAQPAACIPGCDCIPGFFRNKQKQCIPAAFCPGTGPGPAQQCPTYEYPVPCIDKCQTCEYKNGNCAQTGECTPGCNCVPGFLRDSKKKCIPASRCP